MNKIVCGQVNVLHVVHGMRSLHVCVVLAVVCYSGFHAMGGEKIEIDKSVIEIETPFDKGKVELQSNTGVYVSVGHPDEPSLGYTVSAYRLGVMISAPEGTGLFRGNAELLLQLLGASVFEDDPGNYIFGSAILLRYNFVQPNTKWVPYIQLGAGLDYSDIYKDQNQRLIGRQWEYNLEAAIGLRYFLSDRWSVNVEGGYRHISNADSADRNVGLNSVGGGLGLGLHF